ncbi:vacuolar protein sorting-associated protein 13 family protein [Achlya hypogyna]|uniref:Vacuolar protein sorting-associated protein 13 family protein n=1 Tax=Achlya hypogyna TaxID=1202772 RepID=A0A1V9ZND6_ACHHY|nr:vacuolar protein sorting-associated protein 13 family protein [Achlya hypogyna]
MSFLRDAVTKAILRALSAYLVHFEQDQVSVGLWDGDLVLDDVELKVAALNSFEYPVDIVHGAIRSIRIQVPWKSFWRQQIQVCITGLDLEVQAKSYHDVQSEIDEKNRRVQELHATPDAPSWSSWVLAGLSSSLLDRVLKNVQLKLSDIHIHYTMRGVCVGLMIGSIILDDHEAKGHGDELHKALAINTVAVYAEEDALDAPYWVVPAFHIHASMHQPTPSDAVTVQSHCTAISVAIPSSFASFWAEHTRTTRCYLHGIRVLARSTKAKSWRNASGIGALPVGPRRFIGQLYVAWQWELDALTISSSWGCLSGESSWHRLVGTGQGDIEGPARFVVGEMAIEIERASLEVTRRYDGRHLLAFRPLGSGSPMVSIVYEVTTDVPSVSITVADIDITWSEALIETVNGCTLTDERCLWHPEPPISSSPSPWAVAVTIQAGTIRSHLTTHTVEARVADWYVHVNAHSRQYHHRVGSVLAALHHASKATPIIALESLDASLAGRASDSSLKLDVASIEVFVSRSLVQLLQRWPRTSVTQTPTPWGRAILNVACSSGVCRVLLPLFLGLDAEGASIDTVFAVPVDSMLGEMTWRGLGGAAWTQATDRRGDLRLDAFVLSALGQQLLRLAPTQAASKAAKIEVHGDSESSLVALETEDLEAIFMPEPLCNAIGYVKAYCDLVPAATGDQIDDAEPMPPLAVSWRMAHSVLHLCQNGATWSIISLWDAKLQQTATTVHTSVHRFHVQDATSYGQVHPDFILPMECDCASHRPMLEVVQSDALRVTLHGIQLTCLYRYYLEGWSYAYDHGGAFSLVERSLALHFPSLSNVPASSSTCKVLRLEHVAFVIPRNSDSEDRLALVMDECVLQRSYVDVSWAYCDAPASLWPPFSSMGSIQRDALQMRQLSIFCADTQTVSERYWSFAHGTTPVAARSTSHETASPPAAPRAGQRIAANARVYTDDDLAWLLMSVAPMTLHFVRDTTADGTRDLYAFEPGFRLRMDVAEWSILLSLWYDNMGEYAKFPRPFEQAAPYWMPYSSGPHPCHAPFDATTQLFQLCQDAALCTWEVGLLCPLWELQFELKEDVLALAFESLVLTATGSYTSSFLTTTVVAARVALTKQAHSAPPTPLVTVTSRAPPSVAVDAFRPFRLAADGANHAFQLSSVRFPYGYTMLGIAADVVDVALLSDVGALAFALEYLSTFFYDPEFGYPWPHDNALGGDIDVGSFLAHVESFHSDDVDMAAEAWFSIEVKLQSCAVALDAADRALVVSSLPGAVWSVASSWNESMSSVVAAVPGLEAFFMDKQQRRVLSPVSGHWHYATNLALGQTSHAVDIQRYDPEFPAAPELTVYIYVIPSDVAFVQAVLDKCSRLTAIDDDDDDGDDDGAPSVASASSSSADEFLEAVQTLKVALPPRVGLMLLDDKLLFQKPLLLAFLTEVELDSVVFQDHDGGDEARAKSGIDDAALTHFVKLTFGCTVDVFNNIVRGWEPLVESVGFKVLYEDGPLRGRGLTVAAKDAVQVNVTEYFLNLALEMCLSTAAATGSTGLVNWTGKTVRYFQPQPDAPEIEYVAPERTGPLHSPPIVSVLFEDHMLETTVENQNYLRVLFLNYDAPLDALRHQLASNAAALTYSVSLQLVGFQWLHSVDLNQSGNFLFDLAPDDGHVVCTSPAIRTALRCLVGITKTRYGPSVTLQSQFELTNATSFVLGIRLGNGRNVKDSIKAAPAVLLPQEQVYHVPLQPLYEYAEMSNAKHIGFLYVAHLPSGATGSVTAVEGDGIDLLQLSTDSRASYLYACSPNVHFCLEVSERAPAIERRSRWSFFAKDDGLVPPKTRANVTRIVLHAPLTLENALCVNMMCCVYRHVVHQGKCTKDIVWEGTIKVGGTAHVYASALQDVLYCSILLPLLQCESVRPVTLHVPAPTTSKDHRSVDAILELTEKKGRTTTRPLKLQIENVVGDGGQRAIVFYAPYWLINYTPYGLQYKQETRHYQVAGSSGAEERRRAMDERMTWKCLLRELNCPSFLDDDPLLDTSTHVDNAAELCGCASTTCTGRRTARFATMFSFSSAAFDDVAAFANNLCIKCPKYSWSKGFSLEALGIDQVVELKNPSGIIPVGVRVSHGPDVFYRTRCVTFTPRYLIFNHLRAALALYDAADNLSMTMAPSDVQPFHPSTQVPAKKRTIVSAQYVLAKQSTRFRSGKFGVAATGPLDVCFASLNSVKSPALTRRDATRGFVETKAGDGRHLTVRQHRTVMDVVRVQSRFVGSTVLTVFRPLASLAEIGYRIENQTPSHLLFYRQATVESPRNPWQVLRPGGSALYTWAEPLAPHQLSICLRHEGGGPRPSGRPGAKAFLLKKDGGLLEPAKPFGRAVVGERKGIGLEDVDVIAFDVLGLQVAVPKPTPRPAPHGAATGSEEMTEATKASTLPHLNFPNPSIFQKPKRGVSWAKVDGDGMTRVLRLRESASLDEETTYFVKEESRLQGLLLELLGLQNARAFAALHAPEAPVSRRRSAELECADRRVHYHRSLSGRSNSFSGVSELGAAPDAPPKEPSSIFLATPAPAATAGPPLQQLHDRVLPYMTAPIFERAGQVLVTVVAASGLPAVGASDACHPYVVVTVGGHEKRKAISHKTYYIERSCDPVWHDQMFVFDAAGDEVRFDVLSHHALAGHSALGAAAMPLADVGPAPWEPASLQLWPPMEKKKTTPVGTLEVVMCRTDHELLAHWYSRLKGRIHAVSERLVYVRTRLAKIAKERIRESKRKLNGLADKPTRPEMAEKAKQILRNKKAKLVEKKNKLKVKWHEQLHHLHNKHVVNDTLQTLKVAAKKRLLKRAFKTTKSQPVAGLQRVKRLFSNKDPDATTTVPSHPLHAAHSAHRFRNVKHVDASMVDHVTEIKAHFERLVRLGGTLRVTIVEGRGFDGKGDRIWCKLTSEGAVYKTKKLKGDATMLWKANAFEIPLRRQRGCITIQALNAGATSAETPLGTLQLSVEAVLEFCATRATSLTGWFPLVAAKDTVPLEKDLDQLVGNARVGGALGYCTPSSSPCLKLELQYDLPPTTFVLGAMVQYASVRVPEVALSLSAHVYPIFSLAAAPRLEMQEVLRLSFDKVDVQLLHSTKQKRVAVDIDAFQVDNQRSFSHGVPVVLSRAAPSPDPLLHATVVVNVAKGKAVAGLTHLEYIALMVQDIDLTFDEAILRTLYDILERLYDKHAPQWTPAPAPPDVAKVYIAHLEVSPFKANITFRKSYTADATAGATLRQHFKSKFAHSFAAGLVNVAKSIENAPLQFSALVIQHEITDAAQVREVVVDHYTTSLLRQLYKLVGAMNFMGNPVGLAASVRDGLKDFVVAPYVGLVRSGARGLLRGVTRGTLSLMGHTAFGVLDTTSRMTTAVGNSVAMLSRDRVYAAKRAFFALARPSSRREQLRLGVNKLQHDVAGSLLGGVTGLVVDPMRGAQSGPRGLAVGVAKGVSGAVVKPVVGAIDLTTHMLEGLRDVAGLSFDSKHIIEDRRRKRIAHTFGADGRLLPHDPVWNWAKALLVSFDPVTTTPKLQVQVGDVFDKGQVLWATAFKTAPGEYLVVVVRKGEIFGASVAAHHWQQPTLKWRVARDFVQGIALQRGTASRIVLYLHKPPHKEASVTIGTVTWEDSRNFENDERKLQRLFELLSRQYHVVGGATRPEDRVGKLQRFAFNQLLATQETLKTQYCLHQEAKAALERSPWVGADDAPLWAAKPKAATLPTVDLM